MKAEFAGEAYRLLEARVGLVKMLEKNAGMTIETDAGDPVWIPKAVREDILQYAMKRVDEQLAEIGIEVVPQ